MYYKITVLVVSLTTIFYVFSNYFNLYYSKYITLNLNESNSYVKYIVSCFGIIFKCLSWIKNLFNHVLSYFYKYLVSLARDYLKDVVSDKELNDTINLKLSNQLERLVTDEELLLKLKIMLKKEAQLISDDPEMNEHVHELIQKQLESSDTSPRTRAAIAKLLRNQMETIVKEPWFESEVKEQIIKLIIATCESDEVKTKLRELLEKLNADLIEKGEITKQLNDLLSKIINDTEFLKNAGSGIRKTLRHTFWGAFGSYSTETKDIDGSADKSSDKSSDKSLNDKNKDNTITPGVIIIKDEDNSLSSNTDNKIKVSVNKTRSNSLTNSGIIENPQREKKIDK